MENSKMLKFGISNVKFALPDEATGSYASASIQSLGESANLSIEPQFNEQPVYADGQIAYVLASDQGLNASLGLVTINDDYEIAMGRKMKITGGLADIAQKASVTHAIYFESNGVYKSGNRFVIKTWMFGVTSSKPTESYEQNTENVNPQNFSMSLKVLGTDLMDNAGSSVYTDEDGNTIRIWKLVAIPGDTGYETFGESVPTPTALSVGL